MASKNFLFGKPPFRYLADHLAQDADFLDDAQHILNLKDDAYARLSAQLAKTDAFLSRNALKAEVAEAIGKGEESDRIASIIYRFGAILHDTDMDSLDAMDALSKAIEEKAERLDSQDRSKLVTRLRALTADPVGIAKQYKAQQLVDAIGSELDSFRFICDIRPIFDRGHKRIDGAIPLAILRMEYTKPDGESDVVELRVTEKQIANFGEKVSDAELKMRMIKRVLTKNDLAIPETEATVAENES